jgi:hypothetical protein
VFSLVKYREVRLITRRRTGFGPLLTSVAAAEHSGPL